jgi:hypothetical protein
MYKLFKAISILIRQFYIPNPFITFEYGLLLNIIAEPFLYLVTFAIVGLYYSRGSNSPLGSILYLTFYIVHVGILMIMGFFQWNKLIIIILILVYIALHMVFMWLRNRIFK